jgi:glycosyltransferase involved in cell wall biosynthesis
VRSLTVIIPVYRAEQALPQLHGQLLAGLGELGCEFEIIYVEDCGGDGSWPLIVEFAAADKRVRGIRMNRNFGQHNALLCGIRAARHELIVTMDDDLQHPVEEIPRLLAALGDEVDVVYGYPRDEKHGLLRRLASQLTKLALASAMGAETARNVSAFRAFRTRLREGFRDYKSPSVSIDVLLTWATTRFVTVHVAHRPRVAGVSGYTLGALIRHAVNLMTGFSTLPLQIASFIGFAFVLIGVLTMGYVLVSYFAHGSTVPGFAFLASIVTIFSGAQLFALGIFGEYLARMHFRSMDRPTYVVREQANAQNEGESSPPHGGCR